MSDTVRLEFGTSPSSLPIVRMVVGGVGSRLELSLDDLEDLYLAVEELFRTAAQHGEGSRRALTLQVGERALTVTAGPFRSARLRESLSSDSGPSASMDVRTVLACVVDSLEVCDGDDDCFSVEFVKSSSGGPA